METRTERRITYSYGVNKNQRHSGFTSFENLQQHVEQMTMGGVNIDKRELREVTYGDWEVC